jgi:hypothetical protein
MRRLFRVPPRVLPRAPTLRYGLPAWLLLSLILTLPDGLALWAPQVHAERSLTSYASAPNLQWRLLLLIALATGVLIAWQSRPGARSIVTAFVAVICVVWGSWLAYWAVIQLAPTLWQPPLGTELPQPSRSLDADVTILALVSFLVVPLGALVGFVSSVLGVGLQWLERGVRQLLSSGGPGRARTMPAPVSAVVSAAADQDHSNPA